MYIYINYDDKNIWFISDDFTTLKDIKNPYNTIKLITKKIISEIQLQ